MASLERVLARVQEELLRRSQRVDGREVLPDEVTVELGEGMTALRSVLDAVAEEFGEALVEWARARGAVWYGEATGPRLSLEITASEESSVRVRYSASGNVSPWGASEEA